MALFSELLCYCIPQPTFLRHLRYLLLKELCFAKASQSLRSKILQRDNYPKLKGNSASLKLRRAYAPRYFSETITLS